MPDLTGRYNTLSQKPSLLLAASGLAAWICLAGCPSRDPPKAGDAATLKPAHKSPPWAKKTVKRPAQPDEAWIKDLKAVSPREIVRRYLTLSAQGDLTKLRPLVLEACHKGPIGMAVATLGLGARMKIVSVDVELVEEKRAEKKAIVGYSIKGDVLAEKKPTEINILGKKVMTKPAPLNVKGIKARGKLHLSHVDGQWKVACPKLPKHKQGFVGEKMPNRPHIPHLPGLGGHGHKKQPPAKKGPAKKGHDSEGHDHEGHKH